MAKNVKPAKQAATRRQRPAAADPHAANPDEGESGPFPIVGIGMSAGGLEVATEFLKAMPADSGLGFVIVQHLEPTRKSLLAELLGRHTAMPVVEIEDGMRVQPNHVYVIVPAQTLLIEDGILRLSEPLEPRGQRHPIDRFFTALAEDRKTRAIAIVLTGAGSNGTAGIQDIKLSGGMCIAQEPDTAKFDSMPRHAIDSGAVDYVLAPAQMPEALIRYARHPYIGGRDALPALARADDGNFEQVLTLIRARAGLDFRLYKRSTLTRRTHRRMGLAGIELLGDYLDRLRSDPAELNALAKDMMINVTGFFRDPEAWEVLDRDVVQPLVEKSGSDQAIRAWVPACSTGEEAYTIAMLIAERVDAAGKSIPIKIFATDLAEANLSGARRGVYPGSMVESLSPERLERFFEKTGETYRIKPEIRESVVFASQNLLTDPPYSKMDLVSCRNLLIYLDTEGQERVLALAHFALREGGYLFLGNAESIGQRGHHFKTVSKRWRIYQRIGPVRPAAIDFPTWPTAETAAKQSGTPKLAEVAVKALADRFAPASVVIDRQFRIHHFHGATEQFLAQPAGPPTLDVSAMAREGLGLTIRRAVKKAIESDAAVTVDAPRGPNGPVAVSASPLGRRGNGENLLLVSFSADGKTAPHRPRARRIAERIPEREFDDELKEARDELQAVAEEYETANEELKAANEEATSVNEELQATNEELESTKEELQSLNEELTAVNAQLERKVAELDEAGDDLRNLLAGNEIATIFLDTRLRIKWFTPAVTTLFDVIDTDIGRPLANLAQKFADGDLIGRAKASIERLATFEEEVKAESGKCFLLRVHPYRTRDNRIAGAVASFIDISDIRATRAEISAARDYAEAVVRTVNNPLIVLDDALRVQRANPAFYRTFRTDAAATEDRPLYELGDGEWDVPDVRTLLENLLPNNDEMSEIAVEQDFPGIGRRHMLLNARRIAGDTTRPDLILLAIEDATDRIVAERHQEMLVGELSHRVKNTLAVVQSLAMQTLRRSDSLKSFNDAFLGRLQALGRAHDIVLKNAFRGIALDSIIEQALKPFQSDGQWQFEAGPVVELGQVVSQSLTMVLHELATNAVKYGALSTTSGRVTVGWQLRGNDGAQHVVMTWRESGGPKVARPQRTGQGTRFIEKGIAYELRGTAKLDFKPDGLEAVIDFPLRPNGASTGPDAG